MHNIHLHHASRRDILRRFDRLVPPAPHSLRGGYAGFTIGRWWMRLLAWPMLHLGPLAGWCGKTFLGDGRVLNRVQREGEIAEILPIREARRRSMRTHGEVLALLYGCDTPAPWRWVIDELRVLDERHLLGITIINLPLLRRFPAPFLLRRIDSCTP